MTIFAGFFTLLQQAQPAAQRGPSLFGAMIPFILVFVIFYLLIIRPSRAKQKKHQEMVEQLKPGNKIITSGGIHGTVMGVQKDRIELKIASNVKIEISKNAVAAILTPPAQEKK
ncbi:MAG: preprotein translocase subunit YajC [Candidatus Aminicenantes bacterium]|nr:preprotein translocase subunit YajC [Candidatus Aminicenantes bacterium]